MSLYLVMLWELKRKPQHIGEMKRNLKNKNIHKVIRFTLGSMYMKVKEFEKKEYVVGEKREEKGKEIIVYSITPKGINFFEKVLHGRFFHYETNIYVDANELIVNFEYINKKDQLNYLDEIKNELGKKKEKLYQNKNFVSCTDKMIFRQQIKVISALEEWIEDEKNEILADKTNG